MRRLYQPAAIQPPPSHDLPSFYFQDPFGRGRSQLWQAAWGYLMTEISSGAARVCTVARGLEGHVQGLSRTSASEGSLVLKPDCPSLRAREWKKVARRRIGRAFEFPGQGMTVGEVIHRPPNAAFLAQRADCRLKHLLSTGPKRGPTGLYSATGLSHARLHLTRPLGNEHRSHYSALPNRHQFLTQEGHAGRGPLDVAVWPLAGTYSVRWHFCCERRRCPADWSAPEES